MFVIALFPGGYSVATITIKDIARAVGVNVATVSRALNNQDGVSEGVRDRIKAVASEMGYQPNALARSLVKSRSNTIGFLMPDLGNPFFVEVATAVRDSVFARGYTLVMFDSHWDREMEANQLRYLEQQRVDGLIMKSPDRTLEHVQPYPFPVVFISVSGSDRFSTIDTDNFYGGFLAGEALARCGYERIAYFGSRQDPPTSFLRREGCRSAMRLYGLAERESRFVEGEFSIDSGRRLLRAMLRSRERPDAVFCANDMIALGVLEEAAVRGLRIPDDFGVIGFDNSAMSSLGIIMLSTVAQQGAEMGAEIADMLMLSLRGGDGWQSESRVIQPRLILRKTTRAVEPYDPTPSESLTRPTLRVN